MPIRLSTLNYDICFLIPKTPVFIYDLALLMEELMLRSQSPSTVCNHLYMQEKMPTVDTAGLLS